MYDNLRKKKTKKLMTSWINKLTYPTNSQDLLTPKSVFMYTDSLDFNSASKGMFVNNFDI